MKLSLTDQIIVVAYLAAIMGIGFAMKRRASKGMSSYFLGGRRLPWWALAMSGSSSYFDITGTMWIVSTFRSPQGQRGDVSGIRRGQLCGSRNAHP